MDHHEAAVFAARWAETVTRGGTFGELLGAGVDPAPFEERAAQVRARLGPLIVSVDEVVCEGDRLAWRWTLRADGATVTGVNFQRLAAGRLVEHWTLIGSAR